MKCSLVNATYYGRVYWRHREKMSNQHRDEIGEAFPKGKTLDT